VTQVREISRIKQQAGREKISVPSYSRFMASVLFYLVERSIRRRKTGQMWIGSYHQSTLLHEIR
jgi:hypothetical protein